MKSNKSLYQPQFPSKEWYGTAREFTEQIDQKYLIKLQDPKTKRQELETIHKKHLLVQQEKVSQHISLCRHLSTKLERVNSQVRDVNFILREQEIEEFRMSLAATVIQKHVRGFLTRKHVEPLLIAAKLKKTKEKINKIVSKEKHYLYEVGAMPVKSAIIIQKAYRRYLLKCKLDRLMTTYQLYLVIKEEANYAKLKHHLHLFCLYCLAKDKKFTLFKTRKLKEIKEKIASRKIIRILRSKNIKLHSIIDRIKKYKRILRAIFKKKTLKRVRMIEEYNGNPEEVEKMKEFDIENISVDSKEEIETTTSDREAMERERLLKQLMEERQIKISLGKIAYNFKDPKIAKLFTLLEKKEVPEVKTKIIINGIKEIKSKPPRPKKLRFAREEHGDEPGYMKFTMSFSNSQSPPPDEKRKKSLSKRNKVDMLSFGLLLEPTASFLRKVRHRSTSSEMHNESIIRASFDISPRLQNIKDRASPIRKTMDLHKKTSDFSLTPHLPEISTQYNCLPSKVKPRAEIMKGFAKPRAIPQVFFS